MPPSSLPHTGGDILSILSSFSTLLFIGTADPQTLQQTTQPDPIDIMQSTKHSDPMKETELPSLPSREKYAYFQNRETEPPPQRWLTHTYTTCQRWLQLQEKQFLLNVLQVSFELDKIPLTMLAKPCSLPTARKPNKKMSLGEETGVLVQSAEFLSTTHQPLDSVPSATLNQGGGTHL